MLNNITPVVLTYNEEANVGRCLERLTWAREVVVVDSFSTDSTLSIASIYANVRVVQRAFDDHSSQWNFAVKNTFIGTSWILALDADYILSQEFIDEVGSLEPGAGVNGFKTRFIYCINGKKLRASLYPPSCILFRNDSAAYVQNGHTQKIKVEGNIGGLAFPVFHDDRKSLGRWIDSQKKYAECEAAYITATPFNRLNMNDRIRALRIAAPSCVFLYCLFIRGLILDGKAGMTYSLQRAFAEILLSLYLFDGEQRDPREGERS